ncbi:Mu-like prophage FluMu protein gp41 [Pluralibacter gergoviae]|nr:Mu-like prophage FluMu protein gp41 [Pluralibacter gergoviae]
MCHRVVTFRELTSKDVIDAQLAAERVVISDNGKAVAYCSEVLMGVELLRRQILQVGELPGPALP